MPQFTLCLLCLIPETDPAKSLFLTQTWNNILFAAGVRKFLLFQLEFPLWIFSPHKSFDDGSKRWYANESNTDAINYMEKTE